MPTSTYSFKVSKIIYNSKYLAVFDCACRTSAGNCDAPIKVCLLFGTAAKFLVDKGDAVELTHETAMNILDQTEKAGLFHTSNNSADKTTNTTTRTILPLQSFA